MIEAPPPPQHLIDSTVRIVQPPVTNSGTASLSGDRPRVYSITVQNSAAPWLRDAVSRISQLTALKSDWDTYGARPIDATAAASVAMFLLDHAYSDLSEPTVVPMCDGGIQLEWHRGGIDLEIAFSAEEPGVYLVDLTTGQERELPIEQAGAVLAEYRGRLSS